FDDAAERALYICSAIDELMMEEEVPYNNYVARYRQNGKSLRRPRESSAILSDRLDNDDWNFITLYRNILQPVKRASNTLQGQAGGRCGAIWRVYEIYEDLLEHFEDLRQRHPINEPLLQGTQRQKQNESQRQSSLTFDASDSAITSQVADVPDDQTTFEHHFSTGINAG
ncbi:hypothetical protein LTR22_028412, partial [Elasticomyces elasticus]